MDEMSATLEASVERHEKTVRALYDMLHVLLLTIASAESFEDAQEVAREGLVQGNIAHLIADAEDATLRGATDEPARKLRALRRRASGY